MGARTEIYEVIPVIGLKGVSFLFFSKLRVSRPGCRQCKLQNPENKFHIRLIMRSISLYWLVGLVDSSVIEMVTLVPIPSWWVHLHVPWHAVWNGYGCDSTHSNALLVGGCLVGAPSLTVYYT